MSESKFKTMRHIETVRNYLSTCIIELLNRSVLHDQSKLQTPEVEIFEEYTPKLRGITYGSDEYKACMKEMKVAIDHHNTNNRHHPEFHNENALHTACGVSLMGCMNLIDLIEMICDWKAATMRHNDGDITKSIEINQERFGYSDELKNILRNTANFLTVSSTYHKANES